jgi:SAM-dependent methyltransferase
MTKASERYEGVRGEDYSESRFRDGAWGQQSSRKYRLNFRYFAPYLSAEQSVLDFGCGNGGLLLLVRDAVRHAEGLEVNPASRALAERVGLTVHSALDQLPTVPTYDLVISDHVLEHVRDVCSTLERVRVSMKSGARLVVKLPFDDIHEKRNRRWQQNDLDFHLHTFSVRNFANVLFETGFEVERCEVITSASHPRLYPLRRVGLERAAYWAVAVLMHRRQIFAVGRVP